MENLLRELVERLKAAYGDDLLAVVLYGSAATSDYHEKHSDLNILCVLKHVELVELEGGAEAIRWWIKRGQPPPLLLSAEEIQDGCDAFPIEFLDIKQSYRLLDGQDLVAGIQVSTAQHRQQLEHELRSRLLRLRKRFLETQHDSKGVAQLMIESLPTFATLFRHTLLLSGLPAPVKKHEIFRTVAEHFQIGPVPFVPLLEVRKGNQKLPAGEVRAWFQAYLAGITRMTEIVDRMD